MSVTLDALGAPWTCDYQGKTYKLAPPDRQDIKAQYVNWLRQNAWNDYADAKRNLSAQDFLDYGNNFRLQMAGKAFDWGGVTWMSSMGSSPGQTRLTFLMLQAYDAEITEEFAFAFFQANYERVLFELQGAIGADPNARTPQ
jgi:hypothetical protein